MMPGTGKNVYQSYNYARTVLKNQTKMRAALPPKNEPRGS
ncbi:MAG: hypothetical protein ACI85H_001673, partial [Paracoccaceae bacterium]